MVYYGSGYQHCLKQIEMPKRDIVVAIHSPIALGQYCSPFLPMVSLRISTQRLVEKKLAKTTEEKTYMNDLHDLPVSHSLTLVEPRLP